MADNRSAMEQGWYQIYALLITLVISIVGGIIAGNVAQNLCSRNVTVALPAEVAAQITSARKQNQHFDDSEHWVLEEEEKNGTVTNDMAITSNSVSDLGVLLAHGVVHVD